MTLPHAVRAVRIGMTATLALVMATVSARADDGFEFGSYGRVIVGTDLRGGDPEELAAVSHPPRIIEPSYLELDFYYTQAAKSDIELRTVATLAFGDQLFHYTGEFDAQLAIRNLYGEAVIGDALGVWIGSRMYRGDDVYLLDWWPLDDTNAVGAGMWWLRDRLELRSLLGVNRLDDPYQFQRIEVPADDIGTEQAEQLDRQRFIGSASASYRMFGDETGPAMMLKLYGNAQGVDDGEFRRDDDTIEVLPSDYGWTAGAQLGAWGFGPRLAYANLFVRYARGLAAVDELEVPTGLDEDKRAYPDANEFHVAISAGYELARLGALVGAYVQRFEDADPNTDDRDDGWEYAIDIRPYVAMTDVLQLAVDLSYQRTMPRGISPTALEVLEPAIAQVAPMLVFSPRGPGGYDRPQYRIVYRAARLNDGARDLFPLDDIRRTQRWQFFLGFQIEWWFNSYTYD